MNQNQNPAQEVGVCDRCNDHAVLSARHLCEHCELVVSDFETGTPGGLAY